ncbi:phospholipase A2 inhibitor and Ly6/PLAUR domain-containing protein-like [Rana temporaria]|uniref:phospholipase A2 inhibitor and Ly6/PLAUR domain-containing protein-like n=1 Tax=Rana temporaria TaxID=8407 RepID=UPI001AAD29A2|nr:phospholipase A2 inhibitor and Ly6/PLAUR domain-containing protein-like [Rana temporaria]
MASLLKILGVLSALVTSGYSLSCTKCSSSISDSCTGPSETCPSGSLCGAGYAESWALGIRVSKSYTMSCVPQDKCDKTGSMSLPNNVRMKMGTTCCKTDQCTPTFPSLPRDSSGSNGLTCRSCISDSTWCYTSDTMQCTGDENMCLLQTTKVSGPKPASIAMRGCATKSICNLGSESSSAEGVSMEVKFICTSGSIGLQKGFYLPAVICILLLKLLIWND